MFKIWARTTVKDKIIFSRVYEFEGSYKTDGFYDCITRICGDADIPVPVVLNKHTQHFTKFNNTRFRTSDFVEHVGFEFLILENIPEDKPKKSKDF